MKSTFKRVLLAGGTGMVGRNILEHPLTKKREFFAPDSSELNLFDFQTVKTYIAKIRPDIIIHAAGKVGGIHANIADPIGFLLENLDMGRNLVRAARESGVKALINLGSSCMYPRNAANPLKEEMILQGELEPTNEGYALAKVVVSRLCLYITRENPEYRYKTLIPCNLYGRWDKFSPGHSHMIPAVIRKLHIAKMHGDKTVDIWGDGAARREFMYAGDVADCIHRAIEHFDDLPELMNVGLGTDNSIDDFYRTIAEVIGYKGAFLHDLSKPAGMSQKLVDTSRLMAWGWSATTPLTNGISSAYKFFQEAYGEIQ